MALQILQRLYEHAKDHGSRIAIHEVSRIGSSERSVTFAQLLSLVQSYASMIRKTVAPGEVVVINLSNRAECTAAFLGALSARTIGFLMNPSTTPHELMRATSAVSAKAIFGCDESTQALRDLSVTALPLLDQPKDGEPDSPAPPPKDFEGSGLMLLSSGTTADPKIVMRTGASLDAVARNVASATNLTVDDSILGLIPLCHSYGVEHGILAPTYAGCCVHLCQRFDMHMVGHILKDSEISVFPGVPSIFEMLAAWGKGRNTRSPVIRFPKLRCAFSAGSQLPMSVFESCTKWLQLRIGQLYGSSEVGSVTFNDPHAPGHDPMSVGHVMQGVVAKILDVQSPQVDTSLPPGVEGQLAIHAPSMLSGYVGHKSSKACDPSSFLDGFFLTGDLARQSVDGTLTITGRIKLLIDVGALKVNPIEVESVLASHEGVEDCVVVCVPVTKTISRVRALIVPKDINDPPSMESLRCLARARLSPYKVPRVMEIVESLPKSPTGKILRRQIAL